MRLEDLRTEYENLMKQCARCRDASICPTCKISERIELTKLRITAESHVDLSQSLGLSHNPTVDRVSFKVHCKAKTGRERIEEIKTSRPLFRTP